MTLLKAHLPCPNCPSSDAYSVYQDAEDQYHGYCFSCKTWVGHVDVLLTSLTSLSSPLSGSGMLSEDMRQFVTPFIERKDLTEDQKESIIHYSNTVREQSVYDSEHSGTFQRASNGTSKFNYGVEMIIKEPLKEPVNVREQSVNVRERTVNFSKEFIKTRGIPKESYEFYGVYALVSPDGIPTYLAYPYGPTTVKKRNLVSKDMHFEGYERGVTLPLFGMDKFNAGSAKSITVTEGEDDAVAGHYMLGSKWPCVSVRNGSGGAVNDCKEAFEYLNSFDKIYLCFDNDKPGVDATAKVARLFNPNKIHIVSITKYKDARDYLVNNDKDEFVRTWWNARKFIPRQILGSWAEMEQALMRESTRSIARYPFPTLDSMTHGIRPREMTLFLAPEKIGKALSLDTPLPTPDGWTTVRDLKIGDQLLGRDGQPTTVTYITPEQKNQTYCLTFQDGTEVLADGPHRWLVRNLEDKELILDTETMFEEGVLGKGSRAKFMVPVHAACQFKEKPLPIDPFLLGVWLADGHSYSSYITLSEKKLAKLTEFSVEYTYEYEGKCPNYIFKELPYKLLRTTGLIKNKHIPPVYLRSSIQQRQRLMDGMMFDGWKNEFYTGRVELLEGFLELARSLGYTCKVSERKGSSHYTVRFKKKTYKAIRLIEKVETVPAKCLSVDSPDHLFICGDGWNLTHNTEIFRAIEYNILKNNPEINVGIIHLEENEQRTLQGLLTYEERVPIHLQDSGVPKEKQVELLRKVTQRDDRLYVYSHFGSDDPNVILDHIRLMVTVLGCKIIFLDHLSMLVTGIETEDERRKLDYLATRFAIMVNELDFSLFVISHVNDNGRPRGSRAIAQLSNTIVTLHRDKEHDDPVVRNSTYLTIQGNRHAGLTGPAGRLLFDPTTFTLKEYQEVVNDGFDFGL